MPRQGRINIPGGIYHIIQRGIDRGKIFRDDGDREEFLRRLEEGLKETGHQCYAWVLMPNHFHLLIRAGSKPVSGLMRQLLTGYAVNFNKKYRRSGYVYQNRYKSILCQEENYLLELVRYLHLNPLRAGIVNTMDALQEYRWSGHGVLIGRHTAAWQNRNEILERFGAENRDAIKKYEQFVADGKDMGRKAELSGGGLVRSAGGWRALLRLRKSNERWQGDERILGDGDFVSATLKESEEEFIHREKLKHAGWNMKKLEERACALLGIAPQSIQRRSKSSAIAHARSLVMYWAFNDLGLSGVEIAKHFGITKASVSEGVKRGRSIANKKQYHIT